ncbi:MAG: hypothetical protein ACO23O_01325, partial [Ilumatobacteraceae bacterium]
MIRFAVWSVATGSWRSSVGNTPVEACWSVRANSSRAELPYSSTASTQARRSSTVGSGRPWIAAIVRIRSPGFSTSADGVP